MFSCRELDSILIGREADPLFRVGLYAIVARTPATANRSGMSADPQSAVLLLIRAGGSAPRPPEASVLGRAALLAEAEGIKVTFGAPTGPRSASGVRPVSGGWRTVVHQPIHAVYDRFPSQSWPGEWAAACDLLRPGGKLSLPLGNPPSLTSLCRDKLACQDTLAAASLELPPVVSDPGAFEGALRNWGSAFLKPRHGGLGRGVRRVVPGDALPGRGPGARRGCDDSYILQRAVLPPPGWAGVSLRILVQRTPIGGWLARPAVARCSREDPVANVDRGALALPASELLGDESLSEARRLALCAAEQLSRQPGCTSATELGVDLVVGPDARPVLIEINGRPIGRLEHLAKARHGSWQSLHEEALLAPFRWLDTCGRAAVKQQD